MEFPNMNRKTLILIAISFYSCWLISVAWPSSVQTAEEVVMTATEAIYRSIQEQCAEIEQNPLHLHRLVEGIFIPHADFERMAR